MEKKYETRKNARGKKGRKKGNKERAGTQEAHRTAPEVPNGINTYRKGRQGQGCPSLP